jgi:hypothetical protein
MLMWGYLRSATAPGYVFLNLNPLVIRLLTALNKPVQLLVRPEQGGWFLTLRTTQARSAGTFAG